MGYLKALLWSKSQKMQFFKSFSSFPNDIKKPSIFKSCTGSSLTLWPWRATGTSTEVFRWQSVLTCTHVGRAWERQPCFEENWTNFLKKLVLTLNSTYHLRYSSSNFFFLRIYIQIFQIVLMLNGLSQSIAFVQKCKNALFRKFLLIPKWNWQKGTDSNFLQAHH